MQPPIVPIDLDAFSADPYPALEQMRRDTPICFVPQLGATLLTAHNDIFTCEKNVEVFSSVQPGGLMTVLMGENMMRKDGEAHLTERRQAQPALSPRAVKDRWKEHFEFETSGVLDALANMDQCDLVTDFAMPVSGHALRHITGLLNMSAQELDYSSQAMIDGIANYANVESIEHRCKQGTALIDSRIDQMLLHDSDLAEYSLLAVLKQSGQPMDSVRANIKLAISGGQNEPRDAIAGTVWALLTHPDQLTSILESNNRYLQAFEEYARWMSPIGMSPRRIAKAFEWKGIEFEKDSRAFLMFGSGNRDSCVFEYPDVFDIDRNTSKALSFGAGPHFCAGAAASRILIGEVALPMLFERFPNLTLAGDVPFNGWAFRGPMSMPVTLH